MKLIIDHSDINNNIDIDTLNDIINTKNGYRTLQELKAMGAIDYKIAFQSHYIYNAKLLDDGVLYFYNKKEKIKSFILGFIFGMLSSVLAAVITTFIINIIF